MEKEVKQIIKSKKEIVIFLDDEKLIIDEDIYSSHYFYLGKKIDDEEYNTLINEIKIKPQLKYVLKLMSSHYYFEKELFQKLKQRGLNNDEINLILNELKNRGISNDEEYVSSYIEELENKGYGYNRINEELNNKGINYKYSYDEDKEYNRGLNLLNNYLKKYKNYSFDKMKQSIYKSYLSLGYSSSIINHLLNSLDKNDYLQSNQNNLEKDYLKMTMYLDEQQIKLNQEKIMKKLLAKGYHYDEIKKIIEG